MNHDDDNNNTLLKFHSGFYSKIKQYDETELEGAERDKNLQFDDYIKKKNSFTKSVSVVTVNNNNSNNEEDKQEPTMKAKTIKKLDIYNPFILKLIHSKLFYLNKLITIYLPIFSNENHDIMNDMTIHSYHIDMILNDIIISYDLMKKENYKFDIYLLNFEYIAFRLTEQYFKETINQHRDKDSDDGLFFCETNMQSKFNSKTNTNKERLYSLSLLIRTYIKRVYFGGVHSDSSSSSSSNASSITMKNITSHKKRILQRANLFFKVKSMIERNYKTIIESNDDVVHYDRELIVRLMYIYFINEFIYDRKKLHHDIVNKPSNMIDKSFDAITKDEKMSEYIKGDHSDAASSNSLTHSNTDNNNNQSKLIEYHYYDDLFDDNGDYISNGKKESNSTKQKSTDTESDLYYKQDLDLLEMTRNDFIVLAKDWFEIYCIKKKNGISTFSRFTNDSNNEFDIYDTNTNDSIRIEEESDQFERLYEQQCNQYLDIHDSQLIDSFIKGRTNDGGDDVVRRTKKRPSRENNSIYETETMEDNGTSSIGKTHRYVPLLDDKYYKNQYKIISYEILFNIGVISRHKCSKPNIDTCHVCNYQYAKNKIPLFITKCCSLEYNKQYYNVTPFMNRKRLDYYLSSSCHFNMRPNFTLLVYKLLYHIIIILYHSNIIIKDEAIQDNRENDLFSMISLRILIEKINNEQEFKSNVKDDLIRIFNGIDRLNKSYSSSTTPREDGNKEIDLDRIDDYNNKSIDHMTIMKKPETVRQLALDIVLLINIILNINDQRLTIEKYERSLHEYPVKEYSIHRNILSYVKGIYHYYTRLLYRLDGDSLMYK